MSSWTKILSLVFSLTFAISAQAASHPIRVLLVPGHDRESFGGRYLGLKEADLNLDLAHYLFDHLENDPAFQVFSTRDFATGDYTPSFKNYFVTASTSIQAFRQKSAADYLARLNDGTITPITSAPHVTATDEVAYRLSAINKWANDNDIDLVLHIHFNDYPGHGKKPGKYTGMVIYVPGGQFNNATSSKVIADKIFAKLNQSVATSTYKPDLAGVVPDQDLIAIGANNSRQGPSILVEYSYIYEPTIFNKSERPARLQELALQTYRGLQSAFAPQLEGATLRTGIPFWQHAFLSLVRLIIK